VSDAPERTEHLAAPPPAARYARLWEAGAPDLDAFLAAEALGPDERAAVLRVDQRERWRTGQGVPAEDYLRRLPGNPPEAELALDLIYNEFLVRERLGEAPAPEDYCQRFPAFAEALRLQIALHRAVEAEPTPQDTHQWPAPSLPHVPRVEVLPRPFGPYRLLSVLGRGGMGTVYLADDPRLGRQVALKVPHFDLARSPESIARFRREARAAARARHSNLVPIYEVGEVDGIDYLTMPYITGEPLSARLAREGPLPPAEAVRLAVRIADAMETVHRAGVVHRDLKPANVMLDEHSEPAVTDFGLARPVGPADARMTASGTVLGTPAYLAPEQVGCRPEDMGPRCDVYSLGVILYEMLTGRVPFQGAPGEVLVRVMSESPPKPSSLRPGLDPRLEAICLKAMSRRAEDRFASMTQFADALRELEEEPGSPQRGRTRRVALWLAGLVLVAALVWLALWLRPGPGEEPFRAGSKWAGRYEFTRPREFGMGDTELTVTSREGSSFTGTYSTIPDGKEEHRWEVAGTVEKGRIYWELGKPLNKRAREARPADRKATCTGTYDAREAQIDYDDRYDGSHAKMTLRPRQ
jgi:serine/threonine-protein kinase